MPNDFEHYSLPYALWNIGDYFWRLYREDLRLFAEDRTRMDIVKRIHAEWDTASGCKPSGTEIRIGWALAIYDHGDWVESLKTPVPPYHKSGDPVVTVDPRRRYPAEYRCDNGVYVRSLSELCIANWLYANRIPFEYERRVNLRTVIFICLTGMCILSSGGYPMTAITNIISGGRKRTMLRMPFR